MRYRSLGTTGVKVSPLCLGAMMFGAMGNPDHDDCVRIIHRALDAGINFVDTADVYSAGESEEIVGKALKGRRDDVVLATKLHAPMGTDPNEQGNSRRWIVREVENSLRRLDTDSHRPLPGAPARAGHRHRRHAVGAVGSRAPGQGELPRARRRFPAEAIVEAQWIAERRGHERFRVEQPPYSIFVRGIEASVLPTCEQYGMGVIPWSPLNGGFLTGRYRPGEAAPTTGRAARMPDRFDPERPAVQRKLALVPELEKVAADAGMPLTHLAIGFTLAHPAVSSAIIGPRTMEQLEGLLECATSPSTTTRSIASTRSSRRARTSTAAKRVGPTPRSARPGGAGVRRVPDERSVDLHKVDPDGAGLDASRLERITRHLSRGVHRARAHRGLPGRRRAPRERRLLPFVRPDGPRARTAGTRRHDLAHLLDDETDHRRRVDVAVRARSVPAQRPDRALHPRVEGPEGPREGRRRDHIARRAAPADDGARRDDAHDRPRVGRTRGTVRRRDRSERRDRESHGGPPASRIRSTPSGRSQASSTGWPSDRCASIPASTGSTRCRPTCAPGSSRSSRAGASTSTSTRRSSHHSASTTPASSSPTTRSTASPRTTDARATSRCVSSRTRCGAGTARRARSCRAAADSCRRRPTTSASHRCCATAASSTVSASSAARRSSS